MSLLEKTPRVLVVEDDKSVRKLMSATLTGGETVLLSTHYIEDVDHFLDRALILHDGRIAEDLLLDTLTPGDTLLNHMAAACHWDPKRYLEFEEE